MSPEISNTLNTYNNTTSKSMFHLHFRNIIIVAIKIHNLINYNIGVRRIVNIQNRPKDFLLKPIISLQEIMVFHLEIESDNQLEIEYETPVQRNTVEKTVYCITYQLPLGSSTTTPIVHEHHIGLPTRHNLSVAIR